MRKIYCLLLLMPLLCAFQSVLAQDKLYKKNGETILAKVKEIGPAMVTYKRYDNAEGPDYVISNKTLSYIVFENGVVEKFDAGATPAIVVVEKKDTVAVQSKLPEKPHKNIISLVPFQMIQSVPFAFGLQYERRLGKNEVVAVVLPLSLLFVSDDNRVAYGTNVSRPGKRTGTMFWAYPGVKFYVARNAQRTFAFALETNLALGLGQIPVKRYVENYDYFYNYTSTMEYGWQDRFTLGVIAGGSLNIEPTSRLYMGLDLGLGYSFTDSDDVSGIWTPDDDSNASSSNNADIFYNQAYLTKILVRMSFAIGYKF